MSTRPETIIIIFGSAYFILSGTVYLSKLKLHDGSSVAIRFITAHSITFSNWDTRDLNMQPTHFVTFNEPLIPETATDRYIGFC